jgi:hypothetical protein
MRCRALGVAIFIGITTWSWTQVTLPASPKFAAPLQPLMETLRRANASGSLELSRCDFGPLPHIPSLRVPTATGPLPQILREMFADDPAMQVTQDADATIRMIESGVPTDLLDVKIRHLPFELNGIPLQYAAFTSNDAIREILHTPEVLAFAKAHGIVIPPSAAGTLGLTAPHPAESPHIVGSMDDLTVSQALDKVLKTFPGIWVYEDCACSDKKDRCPYIWHFNLNGPGMMMEE